MRQFTDTTNRGLQDADKSARSFGDGLKAGWEKAKGAWVGITAAVLAAKKAFDLMNQAAQFQEREQAFANMAASHGANADRIIADMKRISRGTIDTMTIMEKAGTAMTLGIAADKLDELMQVARASSKITGQTVSAAFSDITLAVGRQSKMILDNLGIIVKVEDANERYAQKLHKTAEQLTEAEKKQAFLNATLEAGGDIVRRVGSMQDSAAERIQRYQARWSDASYTIGKALLTVAQVINIALIAAETTVWRFIEGAAAGFEILSDKMAWIPKIGKHFSTWAQGFREVKEGMQSVREEGIKQMSETWDAMTSLWIKSKPVHRGVIKDLEDQGAAAKKASDEVKKLMDLQKSDAEKRQAAIEKMYQEAGINAEGFYREEINKVAKQAKTWKDAGVNIADINEWMFARIEKIQEEAFSKGAEAQADWLAQLKWHAGELVTDLEDKEADMMARFAKIGQGIKDLDGSQIGVHVQLYDQPFVDGVERLIESLERLKNSQSAAGPGSGAAGSGEIGSPDFIRLGQTTGTARIYEGSSVINVNINEKMSRSDISNIIEEQTRQSDRS